MGERQGEDKEPPEEEEDRRRRPRGQKYSPIKPHPQTTRGKLTPCEQKRLATLVRKYAASTVAKATQIVGPSRARGRPRKGVEAIEPTPPPALGKLTPRERERLATLVRKHGADVVAEAARLVGPSRRRGAPRKAPNHARLERIALADLFDKLVEEHRAAGRPHPIKEAMRELFEIARPSFDPDPVLVSIRTQFGFPPPLGKPEDAFRRFDLTTKRKLAQGRRDLKIAKERAAAIERKKSRE